MEKERNICKLVIQGEQYNYPIYAELIRFEPKKDKYGYDQVVYKELLTGMGIYVGYEHPLLNCGNKSIEYYSYPYTHPDMIVSQMKCYNGIINGLYFDKYEAYKVNAYVSNANDAKAFYKSLYPNKNFKISLEGYLEMLDNAFAKQIKDAEEQLKENIKNERLEQLYTMIHENNNSKDFVEKLLTR